MTSGVTSASAFCRSASGPGRKLGSRCRSACNLTLLELGLGDDVAVHLDEDLFDDVALDCADRPAATETSAATQGQRKVRFIVQIPGNPIVYAASAFDQAPGRWSRLVPQVFEQLRDPLENAARGARIFVLRLQNLRLREARRHLAGRRPGGPPRRLAARPWRRWIRAVHGRGRAPATASAGGPRRPSSAAGREAAAASPASSDPSSASTGGISCRSPRSRTSLITRMRIDLRLLAEADRDHRALALDALDAELVGQHADAAVVGEVEHRPRAADRSGRASPP